MLLEEIIKPDSVLCNAQARSKKHCLEILSELLVRSHPGIASEDIFEGLIERERLGCTSLDQGVAFPHCRVDGLDSSIAALYGDAVVGEVETFRKSNRKIIPIDFAGTIKKRDETKPIFEHLEKGILFIDTEPICCLLFFFLWGTIITTRRHAGLTWGSLTRFP